MRERRPARARLLTDRMADESLDGIRVNEVVVIPRDELVTRASRAGGAGGQHVNTSSTRIELVWNVGTTRALD